MGIRLPLQAVLSYSNATETGAGSVSGGIAVPFTIPQDTDNVVVKFTASIAGTGVSATFQTTDDGGTTWWDVARTSIVSNANSTVTAEWMNLSVTGSDGRSSSVVATGSVIAGPGIGRAGASTLSQLSSNGMPILSPQARLFVIINGNITSAASNSIGATVSANSQSAGRGA